KQERIMSALLKLDEDLFGADGNFRCGINEVAKDVTGFCRLVSIGDLRYEEAIEARSHQCELKITIDFERHSRREGIHMKEIDSISNAVLDNHSLGVASDQLWRRSFELISQQEGRLFVTEIGNGDLSDGSLVIRERNFLVNDFRTTIFSRDILEFNPSPGRGLKRIEFS